MNESLRAAVDRLKTGLDEALKEYLSSQKDVVFSSSEELSSDCEEWLEDETHGFLDGIDWDEAFEPWRNEDEDE